MCAFAHILDLYTLRRAKFLLSQWVCGFKTASLPSRKAVPIYTPARIL